MSGFTVRGVNHTSFTVGSLDRAIAFFSDTLGFDVLSRAPRDPAAIRHITGVEGADIEVAFLQAPGHRLELIEYRAPAGRGSVSSRPCDTGFAHLAFDVDDIDAAIAASAPHGVEPVNDPWVIDKGPNAGNRVAYLGSDNGFFIEFIEKR